MSDIINDDVTAQTSCQISILTDTPEVVDMEFPQNQDLFNDLGITTPPASKDNRGSQSIDSSSDVSLLQTQLLCTPTRVKRTRALKKANRPPLPPTTSEDTSDVEQRNKKFNLKEIFAQTFSRKRKKKARKNQRQKYLDIKKKKRAPNKPHQSISIQERRRRMRHRGICFPFTAEKYLPYKRYFAYEQSVYGGFLHYVEKLKYERYLRDSLRNMSADDEIVNESLHCRRHKYLDDDGPISPISETGENIEGDQEESIGHDAKIVENSAFILNCTVPSKKQWCLKKRKRPKVNN